MLMSGLPLVLLLVAFALRVFRLGDQNVWWDEGLAIWAVRKPLAATTLWTASDVHPPLFFWTLWGWVRLVGQSTFAARYLMVAWSLLLAAVAYALGRRVAGRRGGLLALTLVTLSRFLVWWSMELRMYMLAGLAVTAAVYATLRWLDEVAETSRDPGRPATGGGPSSSVAGRGPARPAVLALAGYVVAATAALYTVYMTAAALAVCNVVVLGWWLLGRRRRRDLAAWLAAQLAVALLFSPWLALALPRMKSWSVVAEPASLAFVLQLWATLLATGVSVALDTVRHLTWLWWLAALLVPLAWLAIRRVRPSLTSTYSIPHRLHQPPPPELGEGAASAASGGGGGTGGRPSTWLLALFLLFPPLIVWLATQPRALFYSPNVEARYFLPFAVPVYVLAGWLLARAWRLRPAVGVVLAGVSLVVMVSALPGHYTERRLKDSFASMSLAIWSQAEPGDVVLLVSGNRYPLFLYDYDQPWDRDNGTDFTYLAPDLAAPPGRPPVIPFPDRGSDPIGQNDWQERLAQIVAEHPRVWLVEVDRQLQDPDGRVLAWLSDHSSRALSEGYGANALHLFAWHGRPPRVTQLDGSWPSVRPWAGRPEPGFQPLVGLPATVAMPGDTPSVTLFRDPAAGAALRQPSHLFWLAWPEGLAPTSSALLAGAPDAGAERLRGVVPVSERTPSGRGPLGLWLDEAALGSLTVRGTTPGRGRPAPVEAEVGSLRLAAALVTPGRVKPGEPVTVDLIWEPPRPQGPPTADTPPWAFLPDPPPVVFAHLVGPPRPDTGEAVWAGQDGLPSSGAWGEQGAGRVFDRRILAVDPAAPPGTYTLEVGLYDPDTGERYPVSGPGADPANRRVILGTVEVTP